MQDYLNCKSYLYDFEEKTLEQLLNKFFDKINNCIDEVNLSKEFWEFIKTQGLKDEVIKQVEELYNNGKLTEVINKLASDVNLKVETLKEEVNTQLEQIETEKATKEELMTERNRIDNLIIHSGEGTEKDSEVVDARVNNVVYSTLGDNIRNTTSIIYSLINNVFNFKKVLITNLLNISNMTDGKIINGNGVETTQDGCSITNDYLYLKNGDKITINFATYLTIVRYNSNKLFQGITIVNNEDAPFTFTATEDMYVRFNIYTSKKSTAMVVTGEVLPPKYIEYGEKNYNPTEITFLDFEKINKMINDNFYTNLLNKNSMTDGKLINASGIESVQSGCSFTNDYLLLRNGESITLNFATYLTIACYDLNKKFKTNKIVNNEDVPFTFTATEDMYLRFNVYTGKKERAIIVKGTTLPNNYIGYNQYSLKDLNYNNFSNVLSGSYLFAGDSICFGAGATETGGYAKLIANLNPNMTYKNIGVSGATICRRTSSNAGTSILDKIEEEIALNTSYKHIVLEGGLNDLWNQSIWALGTYDEYDKTTEVNELTICGAFESLIRKCKAKWNDAFIYYIIPHSIDRKNTKLGFDTLKNICKKYNVIIIDLRELSGMDTSIDYIKNTYTGNGDGVHSNDLGYTRFYINPIMNILVNYQY